QKSIFDSLSNQMQAFGRKLQPPAAHGFCFQNSHVCGLRSIFCPAHVRAKNELNFISSFGQNSARLF
ncbi:MAG: hypothetical protein IJX71_03045, partial [Oscillospiraceae bacterium]|nr:hypothetical protein [Oscillospiraceae bacterium]